MKRLSILLLLLLVVSSACIYLPASPGTSGTGTGQAPVINRFAANPETISAGGTSQLSWEVTGATSVNIDNGVGSVAVNGTRTVLPPSTTSYTITAANQYGSTHASAQVLVSGGGGATPPASGLPVINSFNASPDVVAAGGSSVLSWNVANATAVSISPIIGNVNPVSGSGTVTVGSTTTFVMTATNASGSTNSSLTVSVAGGAPPSAGFPSINSFTASHVSILVGGSSTLSWNVSGASQVVITGIGPVSSVGSVAVSPGATTNYTLTATSPGGSWVTQTITVAVHTLLLPPLTLAPVYDFVAQANSPSTDVGWVSGAGNLPFGGALTDARGFAVYRTSIMLEDNNTYDKVLETHPEWVDNGYISGAYFELYNTYAYKVLAGDHFYARVGFIKNASAGKVRYQVMIRCEGGPNVNIADAVKAYDGTLKTLDIDLTPYAGKKADFILRVSAEGVSTQDWFAWEEARITR
jgi:hypothetical protein